MAGSPPKPTCRALQALPAELLLEISKYFTDFPSLNGLFTFLMAQHTGLSLIQNFQIEIFANVIRENRDNELSRVVTAVMTLRNDNAIKRRFSRIGFEGQNFVYKYLRSADIERDGKPHYLQWFHDPIATICDIWNISNDVETLVQGFVQASMVKPSEQLKRPVSSTELYRSRRAFWRFQLCYEMYQADNSVPPGSDSKDLWQGLRFFAHYRTQGLDKLCFPKAGWLYGHADRNLPNFLNDFLRDLCPWEVEELETVRFYLASLVNTLQHVGGGNPSRLNSQPALLQRLLSDLNHWREDIENPVDHFVVANLRSGPFFDIRRPLSGRWPHNGAARKANISWMPPGCTTSNEQWGWRMWDEERIIKRGLILGSRRGYSSEMAASAFRECEHAQSTFVYRWVAMVYHENVNLKEEKMKVRRSNSNDEDRRIKRRKTSRGGIPK